MSRKAPAGPAIKTRLFVEHDLAQGIELRLDSGQSHLLRSVLRLGAGQSVGLFNGRDGEWRAEILDLPKAGARVRLAENRRAQIAGPDVWLCFAPLKKSAIDMVATKATELGAGRLRPVITAQTAVNRVNVTRLQANATEAAEQCERLDVPPVDQPVELLKLLEKWPVDRPLLVCAEAGQAAPIEAEARKLAGNPYGILVGPEGGFTSRELDRMAELSFVRPIGLGPLILRADTAALAALAVCMATSGHWMTRPPGEAAFFSRVDRATEP